MMSLSARFLNFMLMHLYHLSPVDISTACGWLGPTRLPYTLLKWATHQRTENILQWTCTDCFLALLMLHCSESYVFDLPAIMVSTLGFDQLLFHLFCTIQKCILLFKNSHTWSDQRKKDRCVRTRRGTSGLRNRKEERGMLKAHWARHHGLPANWWEYCNNSGKKSEYMEIQQHFPFIGILPPSNSLSRLQKTNLPDLFPWGSEAMAIKSSPLIPLDWMWGGCHTILTPRFLKKVTKWKTQATKVCKLLCFSCSITLYLHLLRTNVCNIYIMSCHPCICIFLKKRKIKRVSLSICCWFYLS